LLEHAATCQARANQVVAFEPDLSLLAIGVVVLRQLAQAHQQRVVA
jgi:hypothetical protein